MSFRKILSNSALVLGGEVADRILRLLLVLFAPRLLGDAAYGKFHFAIMYTNLFLILADFGVHQLLVRDISRDRSKSQHLTSNGLTLKLILASVTIVLLYLITSFSGKPSADVAAVHLMGWAMIAGSFSEFFASVFRAHQRMSYDVIATLIFGAVVNAVGLTVLFMGYNFVILCSVYLLAQMVRLLYCLGVMQFRFVKLRLGFDFATIKYLGTESFTFGILYFFALLYTNVDSTMLSFMTNDETTGWYGVAYRLINAMMFIPVALMKVVFPALSQYFNESMEKFRALFERSFKVMLLVGFSLASLVYATADRIILLMWGEEFLPAAGALKILVWSNAIIFVGTVQTHTTRASNHQSFTAKVVAVSAVLNILLNFALIPRYSLYGAAFATIASELFTFGFHSVYLSKQLVKPPLLKLAPKIIIISFLTILYIVAISEVSLVIIVPSSLLVIGTLMVLTRYFTREEINFIKKLAKGPGKIAIS
ncbi:MAG: flippase [bacterium]